MHAVTLKSHGFIAFCGLRIVEKNTQVNSCRGQIIAHKINCEGDELSAVSFAANLWINDDEAKSYGGIVVLIRIPDNDVRNDITVFINAGQRNKAPGLHLRCVIIVDAVGQEREETVAVS